MACLVAVAVSLCVCGVVGAAAVASPQAVAEPQPSAELHGDDGPEVEPREVEPAPETSHDGQVCCGGCSCFLSSLLVVVLGAQLFPPLRRLAPRRVPLPSKLPLLSLNDVEVTLRVRWCTQHVSRSVKETAGSLLNKIEIIVNFFQVYALLLVLSVHVDFPDLWSNIERYFGWLPRVGSINLHHVFASINLRVSDEYVDVRSVCLRRCC
jgi:hypothetical protein